MKSFAIVIVCYNRLNGVKRLVNELEKVNYEGRNDISLVFSIDKSNTKEVLEFANEYSWKFGEKIIRTFDKRQGLKNHIIKCGDYTNIYDIVTILEDDIFVSNSFYSYAYQAACFYWDIKEVAGISLYGFQKNWINWLYRFEPQKKSYDTYFLKVAQSWGQVWTKEKWNDFKEWYEKKQVFEKNDKIPSVLNDWPESSWLKYHDRYCIENNKYFVYPYFSLSTNFSDPGEHATIGVTDHQVELQYDKKQFNFPLFDNNAVKYDEFMERENLGDYIGIDNSELTINIWQNKNLANHRRYILTTENLPYKVIKTYSIALRPIELNIIQDIKGQGIYLYDSKENDTTKKRNYEYYLKIYSIRSHDYKQIPILAIKLLIIEIYNRSKVKIRKILQKIKG